MKKYAAIISILILTIQLLAQSNEPVRLALITETDEAAVPSDVLTAQLSGNPKLQLLERNEIGKVYREQGLSAANQDYLKLGRLLGVDGLLLLEVVRTPQTTNFMTRLIAVKPGVILTDGSFPWPLTNTAAWAGSVAPYLNSFLPKLALLPKDAIPLSVVNIRSAIQSADAPDAERQLKLLTIQRLSQERQFFVLERQQMQRLGEEKELRAEESAFWNGSYLLEGVVDQNGYSKDVITINARLTPPKGGAPLVFEVNGSRTNYSDVINRLAAKVIELLGVNSTVQTWNAVDEAQQYYEEAKWALKWGVYAEAQAAADSAWALGRNDLACALVRVKSYVSELSAGVGRFQNGESGVQSGSEVNGVLVGRAPPDSEVQSMIKYLLTEHRYGMVYKTTQRPGATDISFVFADRPPDPKNIDQALHALELYYEFSRDSSTDLLKVASATSNWRNSDWYNLGIEVLVVASQVLQNFNFVPASQKPVADKLVELRARTRSVAEWISQVPLVHDSYYVGDRVAVYDELANTIGEDGQRNPNVFSCEARWGCLWQETPEDGVALYRELMSSAVFSYVHDKFWLRGLETPRLVAWNAEDRKRIPTVWTNFIQELNASTNVLWRLEAKALSLADAGDEEKMAASFTNLFNSLFENRDALVANNVDVLYADWGVGALVSAKTGNGISTATKESLDNLYWHEYRSKLEAMDLEYRDRVQPVLTAQMLSRLGLQGQYLDEKTFEQQKQYLKRGKTYDFMEFAHTFSSPDYSKAQALEIQPLISAYKSNLVAQSQNASGMQKSQLMSAIARVGFLENDVNRILNPPVVAPPRPQATVQVPQPAAIAKAAVAVPVPLEVPEIVTNVITISKFKRIPLEGLYALSGPEQVERSGATITAHHWLEGKLLLDFQYAVFIVTRDNHGVLMDSRDEAGSAIGILDPVTEHWEVIGCPKTEIQSETRFYHHSTLLDGELFTCDGNWLEKYDFQNKRWQVLPITDGNNYELFVVNGHLYAASRDIIFEILDGGKSTRILASARRNPAVSKLDGEDLGVPTLFAGPNISLRVCTLKKICTWTGDDWQEDFAAPTDSSQPEIFPDGVLFRRDGALNAGYQNGVIYRGTNGVCGLLLRQDEFFCLANETNIIRHCLEGNQDDWSNFPRPGSHPAKPPKTFWEMPANLLPNMPAALRNSDLYLLQDPFAVHAIVNDHHEVVQPEIKGRDEYDARLLYFSQDLPKPLKVFLKFDSPDGASPAVGINPGSSQNFLGIPTAWMFFSTNLLFCGMEAPNNLIPGGVGRIDPKPGVWMISLAQVDSAVAAQKQIQLEQRVKAMAAAEQAQKAKELARKTLLANLLAKYDRNHNGIIDPDEREEALNDPDFIESELGTIDANHNGWLDAEELAWFDANRNKILDPKEQAGIEITQRLLAARLMKRFDANGDGFLDRSEFDELVKSSLGTNAPPGPALFFPSGGPSAQMDAGQLEAFLKQQTRRGLRWRGMPGSPLFNPMRTNPNSPIDQQQLFKAAVESYWQNGGSMTDRSPFSRRVPPGEGVMTNGTRGGITP
jgi:Ca2+-binding EF-hand superfamily protein